MHFVFFFLFVNQTIAFSMLWATLLRSARTAQIAATLWVIAMSVIAWTAWDGGLCLSPSVPLTLFALGFRCGFRVYLCVPALVRLCVKPAALGHCG